MVYNSGKMLYRSLMRWIVVQCAEFFEEFKDFPTGLQDEILVHQELLAVYGPQLGRPAVDTLKGSKLPNLKEIRFSWERQPYRFFFAFDPFRRAVILVGGCKSGDKFFYKRLIPVAEARYQRYLEEEDLP